MDAAAILADLPSLPWRCPTWPAGADVVAGPLRVAAHWPRSTPAWHPLWAAHPPQFVALDHLWATQPGVIRPVVADYLARDVQRVRNWQGRRDVPWVGRLGADLFIYDGHHRLAAAWWRGRPGAWCRVLDLTPLVGALPDSGGPYASADCPVLAGDAGTLVGAGAAVPVE